MAKGKKKPENIVLENIDGVVVEHQDGDNIFYPMDGYVEFFLDEHGLQWAKFVPINGQMEGQEHCMPRERIVSVIYKGRPKPKREKVTFPKEALRDVHPGLLEAEGK